MKQLSFDTETTITIEIECEPAIHYASGSRKFYVVDKRKVLIGDGNFHYQ